VHIEERFQWTFEELGIEKHEDIQLIELDLTDQSNSIYIVQNIQPNKTYNLAVQSFVGVSFEQPFVTIAFTSLGIKLELRGCEESVL